MVAPVAPKAWVAGVLLTRPHPTGEGSKREINADGDVLEHLRLPARQSGPLGLECGQGRLLIVEAQRLLGLFPGIAPRGKRAIVQPAALLELSFTEALLLLVRVEAVLERLTHTLGIA